MKRPFIKFVLVLPLILCPNPIFAQNESSSTVPVPHKVWTPEELREYSALVRHRWAQENRKTNPRAAAQLERDKQLVVKAKKAATILSIEEYETALEFCDDPAIHHNLGLLLIKSGLVFEGAAQIEVSGEDPYAVMYPELRKGDFLQPVENTKKLAEKT
jgi:hypothetical protein